MNDGTTIRGPLSENAAYNPSLSPMEAALFAMNIAGYSYSQIAAAALCEVQDAEVSQFSVSVEVLGSVNPVPLVYVTAVRGASVASAKVVGGYPSTASRLAV
jgi:cytidine deaminase